MFGAKVSPEFFLCDLLREVVRFIHEGEVLLYKVGLSWKVTAC